MIEFIFIMSRMSGFVIMLPSIIKLPISFRVFFICVLSVVVFFASAYQSIGTIEYTNQIDSTFRLIFEFMVGVFLGLFASIPVHVISLAGYYISQSCAIGNILFPGYGQEHSSAISVFLSATVTTCIFASGFFSGLIEALCVSYKVYNFHDMNLTDFTYGSVKVGGYLLESAARFSLPFFLILLLGYVMLMFINRLSPKVSIIFVAAPIQTVIGIFVLMILIPYLIDGFIGVYKFIAFAPYRTPYTSTLAP